MKVPEWMKRDLFSLDTRAHGAMPQPYRDVMFGLHVTLWILYVVYATIFSLFGDTWAWIGSIVFFGCLYLLLRCYVNLFWSAFMLGRFTKAESDAEWLLTTIVISQSKIDRSAYDFLVTRKGTEIDDVTNTLRFQFMGTRHDQRCAIEFFVQVLGVPRSAISRA